MRTPLRRQDARERVKNWEEVSLGFSQEEAVREAGRCLQCKNAPCSKGCPVEIDIPAFILLVKAGKRREALGKIKEKNNLPGVCGRVCPQEDQCEAACVLNKKKTPINIGALERFCADVDSAEPAPAPETVLAAFPQRGAGKRVAVVGSGPSGLTCAGELARCGCRVTVFESLHAFGGVLTYGIPSFRLPRSIVSAESACIAKLGVQFCADTLIGATYGINDLRAQGFDAVFIGTGAGLPQFLGIEGENAAGVYSANEFLTRVNLMRAHEFPGYATPLDIGRRVGVVGGGNVAMDCSRVALRLGREAVLIYRRSEAEMPARAEEVENARDEGVRFSLLTQPLRVVTNERFAVTGLECIRMRLGDPDVSGRRRPVPVEGSSFVMPLDTLIVAVGQRPNPLIGRATAGLRCNDDGTVATDENGATSLPGIFAGGDITTGADTVIAAMGAGKRAASAILAYLKAQR